MFQYRRLRYKMPKGIRIAILTITDNVQETVDQLVKYGIKAFVDFTNEHFILPKGTMVRNIDVVSTIQELVFETNKIEEGKIMFEFYTVRELFEIFYSKNQLELDQIEYVELEGWVKTNRDNGQIGFIEFNDGTYFKSVQLVYSKEIANYKDISKYLTGTSIKVTGKFKLTPSMKQPFEIDVTNIELIGSCDKAIHFKRNVIVFEFLRDSSLRVRSNTFNAVFRLNVLSMAIHEFFKTRICLCSNTYYYWK